MSWIRGVELDAYLFYLLLTHVPRQFLAAARGMWASERASSLVPTRLSHCPKPLVRREGGLIFDLYDHMATFGAANVTCRINKRHVCFGKGQCRADKRHAVTLGSVRGVQTDVKCEHVSLIIIGRTCKRCGTVTATDFLHCHKRPTKPGARTWVPPP